MFGACLLMLPMILCTAWYIFALHFSTSSLSFAYALFQMLSRALQHGFFCLARLWGLLLSAHPSCSLCQQAWWPNVSQASFFGASPHTCPYGGTPNPTHLHCTRTCTHIMALYSPYMHTPFCLFNSSSPHTYMHPSADPNTASVLFHLRSALQPLACLQAGAGSGRGTLQLRSWRCS